MSRELFIGMISGTSRDGVDTALVGFEDGTPVLFEADCVSYLPETADRLQSLVEKAIRPEASELEALDRELGVQFSQAALSVLEKAGVEPGRVIAIGSHGQTVWHNPDGPDPESIQVGDPGLIAERTGIVTVGDFRRADLDAGGQGAPLAPLLHRAVFGPENQSSATPVVVLNLGGIANISVLEPGGGVRGFDTGPANCLMDAWTRLHKDENYDRDGRWAASGSVSAVLLDNMLADPYFHRAAPKSTGIEYFNLAWLERHLDQVNTQPADVQATLAELTAITISNAIRPSGAGEVLVCGGGIHNGYLVRQLKALLPGTPVRSTAARGLDPDWVEATLFAWLARERLAGRSMDTGAITGARGPVLLGNIFRPG